MNSKKFDVIVVGELNADLILNSIESFPEMGKEKLAQNMNLALGSSSAIFASNLSSLGAKVAFLGRIGGDYFGQLIIDELEKKNVDTSLIKKDSSECTGVTLVMNFGDDRAMVTYQGAMNELTINDITKEDLSAARHLHFSSYYLQPGIKPYVHTLFKTAKEAGLTTSFDMQWDPYERWDMDYKNILPYVDIFFPNEQELLALTGEQKYNCALDGLIPYANCIAVKMGRKGSVLANKEGRIFKNSFLNENVVDAIGAGDSFNAGFIFKFIRGKGLEECLEFGNLMGAVNTTAPGGTGAFKDYQSVMNIAREKFKYDAMDLIHDA